MKAKVIIMLVVFSLPVLLFAQAPPDFDEQVYDVAVPFDGGVSVLVAIGIGYGCLKIMSHRKNKRIKSQLLHD